MRVNHIVGDTRRVDWRAFIRVQIGKNRAVTFRYKDYAHQSRIRSMTLPLEEFLRRFCLHILPPRFVKIRHYGLLSNRVRADRIAQARALLRQAHSQSENAPETHSEHKVSGTTLARLSSLWALRSRSRSCHRATKSSTDIRHVMKTCRPSHRFAPALQADSCSEQLGSRSSFLARPFFGLIPARKFYRRIVRFPQLSARGVSYPSSFALPSPEARTIYCAPILSPHWL